MSDKIKQETIFCRQKAGELIKCVLAGKMTIKQALLAFPKDVKDNSVRSSWHALCHLEADEDLRTKDVLYREEQDSFLNSIAETLMLGESLPEYITEAYKKYYNIPLTPHRDGLKGFLASFENFLNIQKD
ncbi:hypothetical protein IJG14_01485 [bacterium]|nr:hypothetical protein [bacterium]